MDAVSKPSTAQRRAARGSRASAMAGDVRLTHPDRIYWTDVGVTKQDLADYYSQVWKWIRPHVVGRVVAVLRCPEGSDGKCFFQKHARTGIPTEFLHLIAEKGSQIIANNDLDGLIAESPTPEFGSQDREMRARPHQHRVAGLG